MECKCRLADGKRWLPVAMMMQASAGGWMECKRWLADGERRLLAAMMHLFGVQALAGRW